MAVVHRKSESLWVGAGRILLARKAALWGLGIVLLFVFLAIIAPMIALEPYDLANPSYNPLDSLKPPSCSHWFGTDDLGRDIFSRVVYGSRISLAVGLFAVTGSLLVGSGLGLIAGFYGKWVDLMISRVFDLILAFPSILLAIVIVTILGPSLFNALLAIAIINIPTYGRLVRSKVLSIKEEEYITAARIIGMSDARILFVHILPNSISPLIVQATIGIGSAIIEAASLSFLGMGAQSPQPEWGKMLSDARPYLTLAPWTMIFPGVAIMLVVLGFNMFGDGLRDALDPKAK